MPHPPQLLTSNTQRPPQQAAPPKQGPPEQPLHPDQAQEEEHVRVLTPQSQGCSSLMPGLHSPLVGASQAHRPPMQVSVPAPQVPVQGRGATPLSATPSQSLS